MEKCILKNDLNTSSIHRLKKYDTFLHGRAELMFRIYNNTMHEVFISSDVSSLLYVEFMKMIQNNVSVGVCENCGKYFIVKGKYDMKDQSYVLYSLTQDRLSRLLLPIGEMKKEEVREIAEKCGFQSIYYFSKCFKKNRGISPRKFAQIQKK